MHCSLKVVRWGQISLHTKTKQPRATRDCSCRNLEHETNLFRRDSAGAAASVEARSNVVKNPASGSRVKRENRQNKEMRGRGEAGVGW